MRSLPLQKHLGKPLFDGYKAIIFVLVGSWVMGHGSWVMGHGSRLHFQIGKQIATGTADDSSGGRDLKFA